MQSSNGGGEVRVATPKGEWRREWRRPKPSGDLTKWRRELGLALGDKILCLGLATALLEIDTNNDGAGNTRELALRTSARHARRSRLTLLPFQT